MLSLCRNYDSVFNVEAEMKETDAENKCKSYQVMQSGSWVKLFVKFTDIYNWATVRNQSVMCKWPTGFCYCNVY